MKKGFKYVKSSGAIYRYVYDAQGNMRSVHIMPSGRVFKHARTAQAIFGRNLTPADVDGMLRISARQILETSHNIVYFQYI